MSLADRGEPFHSQANELLVDSEAAVAALDLTLFEVANAVAVKMRQPQRAEWLCELVVARCGDRLVRADSAIVAAAVSLATEHDLTAYDAAYVAVAQRNSWTLVSLDVRDLVSKGLAVTPDAVGT